MSLSFPASFVGGLAGAIIVCGACRPVSMARACRVNA
jgi:hypothetical protein